MAWFAMRPGNPCENGLVLRDIFPEDLVCVKPEVREQVKADNAAAREPNPAERQSGVQLLPVRLRLARRAADDLVCVTPEIRTRTAEENRNAPKAKSR